MAMYSVCIKYKCTTVPIAYLLIFCGVCGNYLYLYMYMKNQKKKKDEEK